MQKVVMTGYYGWGNLGDDVLMISAFQILKDIFAESEVIVCCESSPATNTYIKSLLGDVRIINRSTNMSADWIVHGGGGVFFDFSKGDIHHLILNRTVRFLGYNSYRRVYKGYKHTFSRGLRSKYRAGIGIGIGDFTQNSRKFVHSIYSLMDSSILLVRDRDSLSQLKKYNFKRPAYQATDLAFNTTAWLGESTLEQHSDGKGVAFILRDWPYDNQQHLQIAIEAANHLKNQGVPVKFYSFDKVADQEFIRVVKGMHDLRIYEAEKGINDFLIDLAGNACVVTSRAHGAILSACLGISGICILIEPKLKSVAQMLERSYSSVALSDGASHIVDEVMLRLAEPSRYKDLATEDVHQNSVELFDGLKVFRSFVYSMQAK